MLNFLLKNNFRANHLFIRKFNETLVTVNAKRSLATENEKNLYENSFNSINLNPNGTIKLVLHLPARKENCEFTLKFLNDNIESLEDKIKQEDKSIEKIVFYSNEGNRISKSTPIRSIIFNKFKININDEVYFFRPPEELSNHSDENLKHLALNELNQIRELVSKLHLHLNIDQYEVEKEKKILDEIENLRYELEPLENKRRDLELSAKKHTNRMIWLGLGFMSMQAGILARLTWFDYSWDIVEPISYFVSYSAVIGVYAYYVLTRKEYGYESASDRIFLRHFHKSAIKKDLDINKYNILRNNINTLENDLKRIRRINSITK